MLPTSMSTLPPPHHQHIRTFGPFWLPPCSIYRPLDPPPLLHPSSQAAASSKQPSFSLTSSSSKKQARRIDMSGVWVFKNGVVRLVENGAAGGGEAVRRRKALVHTPSGQVVRSYAELESELRALGWERYYEDPALYQFHKRGSLDLISLPADFARFSSVHMYDIVIKNRDSFRVVDI